MTPFQINLGSSNPFIILCFSFSSVVPFQTKSSSASVVKQNAAILFCRKAPEMFGGQQNIGIGLG